MLPKLERFYYKFLLPEIALPRYGTYTGIRQPASHWVSIEYLISKFSYKQYEVTRSVKLNKYPKHDANL